MERVIEVFVELHGTSQFVGRLWSRSLNEKMSSIRHSTLCKSMRFDVKELHKEKFLLFTPLICAAVSLELCNLLLLFHEAMLPENKP
jgi:hypothetical protein